MSKARITYRFDMNRNPSSEQPTDKPKRKVIALTEEEFEIKRDNPPHTAGSSNADRRFTDTDTVNPFKTDFGAWNSPFDAAANGTDTRREEQFFHDNGRQIPRASRFERDEELYENRFDAETGYYEAPRRDEPYADEFYRSAPVGPRYVRRPGAPWLKIVAAVVSAVVTGAVFGFFVLSMFSMDETVEQPGSGLFQFSEVNFTDGEAGRNAKDASSPSGQVEQMANAGQTGPLSAEIGAAVEIPAKTYLLLQHGAFSSEQSADVAQTQLREKGMAAVTDAADKVYVYAGMTQNRGDALALSHELQEQKMDVFIKSLTIPEINKVQWGGQQPDTVTQYFAQSSKLVQSMIGLTAVHLQEPAPAEIGNAAMQTIKQSHQQWNSLATVMGEGLPAEHKPTFQKMTNAMNTAVLSLEEYSKNPTGSYLWQSQAALIQYVLAEKALLSAIALL